MNDKNRLLNDLWKVFLIVLITIIVILYFKLNYQTIQFIKLSNTFLNIYVALLGFIITALTILFMFDTDKNENLKKIKDAGYYPQIIERFISTTIVLFIGVLLFLVLSIFNLNQSTEFYLLGIDSIIFYLLLLTLLRLYRSINVLHLICKLAMESKIN